MRFCPRFPFIHDWTDDVPRIVAFGDAYLDPLTAQDRTLRACARCHHVQNVPGRKGTWLCIYCPRTFTDREDYRAHLRTEFDRMANNERAQVAVRSTRIEAESILAGSATPLNRAARRRAMRA